MTFREAVDSGKELLNVIPSILSAVLRPPDDSDQDNIARRLAVTADSYPDKTAIIFEGRSVTWRELNDGASRVAAALRTNGVDYGDCVSLLTENRIEFIQYLFGISRAGACVSLINTNLRGPQLVHSINTTHSKKLVHGSDHQ